MKKRKLLWICVPVIVLFFLLTQFEDGKSQDLSIFWPEQESILVEGMIYKAGRTSSASTIYLNNISVISESGNPLPQVTKDYLVQSNILIYLKEETEVRIGDYVQISGKCTYPQEPSNPGCFDGKSYYSAQNICMIIKKGIIEKQKNSGFSIKNVFYRLQNHMINLLDHSAGEVESAVLKSILLGDRSSLDTEVKQLYQQNGIIHVLAISGLHISIIGMSLYSFLRKRGLSFAGSSIVSFGFIIFYGLLTGFPTSATRAIIMFGIYLGSQITGRTYDLLTSLGLTATLMLLENPMLVTQSGFQLSFVAVLGVLSSRLFSSTLLKKTGLGVSFSVWLMTLPVTLWSFYQISFSGILLNLFIVPSMTIVLVLGVAGAIVSFVSTTAASFLFGPVHYILKLTLWICELVKSIPGSILITGRPSVVQIGVYYVILYTALFLLARYETAYRKQAITEPVSGLGNSFVKKLYLPKGILVSYLLKLIVVIEAVVILFYTPTRPFTITFLNVGQGDGICIQSETGHVYMVDGGSSSQSGLGTYTLEPYLKYMGYSEIDGWFISHYDNDHVNGLIELLENYDRNLLGKNSSGLTIGRIILPELDVEEELFVTIVDLAKEKGIPVSYVSRGDKITDGGTSFEIVNPVKDETYEDSNSGSMVMKVIYKDLSVLMTGDVQGNGEKDLLDVNLGEIDILKVAHHGSKNSSSQEILEHINPKIAVISCGKNNRYGHPNKEVLDRLEDMECQILRTDIIGAISISVK